MTVEDSEVDTLGRRLDRMGRRLMLRRLPAMAWLRGLQPVLRRLTAAPHGDRFERIEANLPPWTTPAPGEPLQAQLRARVERYTGPGAEALRVHQGPMSEAIAETHEARAVAIGRDVFFNRSGFSPDTPAGFGLLVHEATHVLEALRPGIAWRRSTGAGAAREEQRAGRAEAQARASYRFGLDARFVAGPPLTTAGVAASAGSAPPALMPMRAATTEPPAVTTAAPAGLDMDKLRAQLQRDLLRQLRTDFERGA
jgi:hypothetical protein